MWSSSPLPLGERVASEASRERAVASLSGVATSLSPALRADPLPQGAQGERGRKKVARSCATAAKVQSALRRADARRAAADLDRASGLQGLAVEVEDLDLVLDHALDENHPVILAPGRALAPVPDLRFRDLGELGP